MTRASIRNGGNIPGLGEPAFTMNAGEQANLPVLVAVPHGGRAYPPDLLAMMRHPDFATRRLEDRHIDAIGIQVAERVGAGLLVARAPRAMIDLNRAEDDIDWGMVKGPKPSGRSALRPGYRAQGGLGLVPRRLQGLGEVWRGAIGADAIEQRIAQVHRPYHEALAQELQAIRRRWGAALLLDLHSMPPLPSNGRWSPAHFVIGDRFGMSCDAAIPAAGFACFAREGARVAHNRPYAGGYVLERHGAPARGIHALQLEVDRSIYLDAALDELQEDVEPLVARLSDLVRALAETVSQLGNGRGDLREAAE